MKELGRSKGMWCRKGDVIYNRIKESSLSDAATSMTHLEGTVLGMVIEHFMQKKRDLILGSGTFQTTKAK